MKETIDRAADLGVENIVIGMPQRQAECLGQCRAQAVAPDLQ
jgi:hypothetical protein